MVHKVRDSDTLRAARTLHLVGPERSPVRGATLAQC